MNIDRAILRARLTELFHALIRFHMDVYPDAGWDHFYWAVGDTFGILGRGL